MSSPITPLSIISNQANFAPSAPPTNAGDTPPAGGAPNTQVINQNSRPPININGFTAHSATPPSNNGGDNADVMRQIAMSALAMPMPASEQQQPGFQQFYNQQQPPTQQQQQHSQQQQQSQQQQLPPQFVDPTKEHQKFTGIVSEFLRLNPLPSPIDGIDLEVVSQKLASGDLTGVAEMVNTAASQAHKHALVSVLQMMPNIISTVTDAVMRQVETHSASNDIWSQFSTAHPEFRDMRRVIETPLQRAILSNPTLPREQVFASIALMYDSMVRTMGMIPATSGAKGTSVPGRSRDFDLGAFLGG